MRNPELLGTELKTSSLLWPQALDLILLTQVHQKILHQNFRSIWLHSGTCISLNIKENSGPALPSKPLTYQVHYLWQDSITTTTLNSHASPSVQWV